MSYVLSITIGRSYPNTVIDEETGTLVSGDQSVQLPDREWSEFKSIIERSLKHQAEHQDVTHSQAYFVTVHDGTGYWEGQPEESAIITLVSEHEVTLSPDALNGVGYLATQYKQQAIAITKGESFLVEAK